LNEKTGSKGKGQSKVEIWWTKEVVTEVRASYLLGKGRGASARSKGKVGKGSLDGQGVKEVVSINLAQLF